MDTNLLIATSIEIFCKQVILCPITVDLYTNNNNNNRVYTPFSERCSQSRVFIHTSPT